MKVSSDEGTRNNLKENCFTQPTFQRTYAHNIRQLNTVHLIEMSQRPPLLGRAPILSTVTEPVVVDCSCMYILANLSCSATGVIFY